MAGDESNGATADVTAQYDLLPKMIPYLDRHLIYPLIAEAEDSPELTKSKFELLKVTNMTDYVGGLEKEMRGLSEVPKEYEKKKDEVLKKREQFETDTNKLRGLLEDQDIVSNLRSDKVANLNYLKEHGVTEDMVNALYDYGNFQYSCGAYPDAAELLYQFRVLVRTAAIDSRVLSLLTGASQPTTTRWQPLLGASWLRRSCLPNGSRL
jgi:translation initiation factor 3 subunit E